MHVLERFLVTCIATLAFAGSGSVRAQEAPATEPAAAALAEEARATESAATAQAEEPLATEPSAAAQAEVGPAAITASATSPPIVAAAPGVMAATVATGGIADAPAPGGGFSEADRLVVHKAQRRLELLKGGAVIAQYPIRLGLNPAGHKLHEGDFRTPEGQYYLSRRNPRSEFFLSIGVSYPNDADRRRARGNGKAPGGSIMIHGLPNVPRKPADYYAHNDWTDGCIAVSNSDMVDIWLRTKVGLPIEIRP